MKTLAHAADEAEILQRLTAIGPGSQRQWGRMRVGEMICHLSDALKIAMGEKEASTIGNWFTRSVMKWAGLWFPRKWPRGVQTVPECKAGMGGTAPAAMDEDASELRGLLERFCRMPRTFVFPEHSIFGKMTHGEWMRWGYLHIDHHLRQFGA
jgi:hypothetical protein